MFFLLRFLKFRKINQLLSTFRNQIITQELIYSKKLKNLSEWLVINKLEYQKP